MKAGMDLLKERAAERKIEIPDGTLDVSLFALLGLPVIVACSSCWMTMTILSPSVRVDDYDCVWCSDCAGE